MLLNNSLVIPSHKNYLRAKIFSPFHLSDVIAEYDQCPMTTEKANVHSIALDLLRRVKIVAPFTVAAAAYYRA